VEPVSRNAMTSTPFTVPTQHGVSWVCQCSNLCCPSGLIAPATIGILHPQLNSTSLQVLSFSLYGTLFYKPVGGYVSCYIAAALCLPPCFNDEHSLLRCSTALQLKQVMSLALCILFCCGLCLQSSVFWFLKSQ